MASLYDIDKRLIEYEDKYDPETGEWLNESELDSLFEERRDKIEQLLLWAKDLRADASAIESEEKSLAERRKYKINLADRIEDHVARELNGEKFETSKVLVKWRMTPPSVEILDASKIPHEYLRTTEEVKPDLNKIKAKLKEYEAKGETVDWAKLKRTNKMSVK